MNRSFFQCFLRDFSRSQIVGTDGETWISERSQPEDLFGMRNLCNETVFKKRPKKRRNHPRSCGLLVSLDADRVLTW